MEQILFPHQGAEAPETPLTTPMAPAKIRRPVIRPT